MIEFAEPRVIRIATENDIEPLQKHVPKGDETLHKQRYEQQRSGDATYLIAAQGDVPVGHALIKWKGATDEAIAPNLADPTPDVEDLFVHEAHRNRRVGSRLLEMAERLARERGYKQMGLSCGADNKDARALYEARGYLDSGIAPYTLSGKYKDAKGTEQEWIERDCTYFLLPLTKTVAEAATETNMENNNTNTAEETPEQTTPVETNDPPKTPGKPVSEQVVDFAFGVALTAAEALEKAVKVAQNEAPGVWEALQEKGRPARQKLVQSLREETREETEAATQPKVDGEPPSDGTVTTPEAKPVDSVLPIKPAPRPFGFGRIGSGSAEDEIKALEDRVKSLEREVVSPVVAAPSDAPMVTEEAVNVSEQTSAEKGTAFVDFTPENTTGDALVNSPYAITDDEERAAVPSQIGEPVSTTFETEAESSPEAVSAYVDGAETTGPEVEDNGEPKLAPSKGKRVKKTTSEASAGSEPADDTTTEMTVEELEA